MSPVYAVVGEAVGDCCCDGVDDMDMTGWEGTADRRRASSSCSFYTKGAVPLLVEFTRLALVGALPGCLLSFCGRRNEPLFGFLITFSVESVIKE